MRRYRVQWIDTETGEWNVSSCATEDGYSTTRDFAKMIAIRASLPEERIRVMGYSEFQSEVTE